MDTVIQIDFDGIINPEKSFLEIMGREYVELLSTPEKQILKLKGGCIITQRILYKILNSKNTERVSLEMYENLFLKKYTPPLRFVKKLAKRCSESIPEYVIEGVKSIKHEKVINSIDVSTSIKLILEEVGLKNEFVKIYANDFLIKNKRIVGFKKPLYVDKMRATLELKRDYNKVISVGDGYSDLGMFKYSDDAYTLEKADKEVKKYISENFGKEHVLPTTKELFEVLQTI